MFTCIMSTFRNNKVNLDVKGGKDYNDDEPSILIKPVDNRTIYDKDYADIIYKLSIDTRVVTAKDIKYMHTLTHDQLIYLMLVKR